MGCIIVSECLDISEIILKLSVIDILKEVEDVMVLDFNCMKNVL